MFTARNAYEMGYLNSEAELLDSGLGTSLAASQASPAGEAALASVPPVQAATGAGSVLSDFAGAAASGPAPSPLWQESAAPAVEAPASASQARMERFGEGNAAGTPGSLNAAAMAAARIDLPGRESLSSASTVEHGSGPDRDVQFTAKAGRVDVAAVHTVSEAAPTATVALGATVETSYGEAAGTAAGTTSTLTAGGASTFAVNVARESYIARPNGLYNLGSMFQVNAGASNAPALLSVTLYDRDNYAGKETYGYGTLTATNGATYKAGGYTLNFSLKNGQYVTANGMTLSDFTFNASSQEDRVANVNMSAYASNGALLGSRNVDIVTHATTTDTTAGVSSAAEIAKVAQSFIGKTWDASGCWNLASDIAATAGGSLALNSGWITSDISNNGQWTVAYNAYKGVNNNWMSSLQAGDIVELGWKNANYGHIFTIDRVSNGVAYLVDNSGAYVNKPGSDPNDVYIAERKITDYSAYINQSTVMVFRDNGPVPIASNLAPTTLVNPFTDVGVGKSVAASSLFRSTDADYNAISQYQIRDDSVGGGYFTLNGVRQAEAQWITVNAAQLSQLGFTGSATGSVSDTIEVKAFDGTAWGNADTGRIVSLWDQTNQNDEKTFRNFGAVDKASYATKATEWVGSTDKYDWWNFTISSQATSVDIQLSNMVGQANMWVMDSKGALVGSAYGYAYNNTACKLSGTLGVGTYTVRVDQYLGDTNYDLTIGKTGTLPTVVSGGSTQVIYSSNTLKPGTRGAAGAASDVGSGDDGSYFGGVSPMAGTAPSLAFADISGLGSGSAATPPQLAPNPSDPNNRMLLAQVS